MKTLAETTLFDAARHVAPLGLHSCSDSKVTACCRRSPTQSKLERKIVTASLLRVTVVPSSSALRVLPSDSKKVDVAIVALLDMLPSPDRCCISSPSLVVFGYPCSFSESSNPIRRFNDEEVSVLVRSGSLCDKRLFEPVSAEEICWRGGVTFQLIHLDGGKSFIWIKCSS